MQRLEQGTVSRQLVQTILQAGTDYTAELVPTSSTKLQTGIDHYVKVGDILL